MPLPFSCKRVAWLWAAALVIGMRPAASAAQVWSDVTAESGLPYVQQTLRDPPDCLLIFGLFCEPERMTGGAAAGDADGDGRVDLYVTRLGAHDLLFRNRGDGRFEDVTEASGLAAFELDSNGALWVDVDRDGDLDLYVTTLADTRYYLFVNDGNGHFREEGAVRGADVATSEPHLGWSIAAGDVDRDGWVDLFVGEWRPIGATSDPSRSHSRLLRNRGAQAPGFFDDVTDLAGVRVEAVHPGESWVFAPAFVDLDEDGWLDLALASDFGTSLLFWNDGDGTFSDGTADAGVGTDENGMGSTFGDWDGDGDLDWFVTSIRDAEGPCDTPSCFWGSTGNRLYAYEGARSFSDATDLAGVRDGYWGWGAAFLDGDNDGDLDLAMTNGVDFPESQLDPPSLDDPWEVDPMRYWRNDGAGVMHEEAGARGLTDTGSGKGLLSFDYDEDGDLDLLVVNTGSGARLFRNEGGNRNDWLRVHVRRNGSETAAIGTRVEVRGRPGGPSQLRVVGVGSHFLGQSEHTLHFGLGPRHPSRVFEVELRLPDGGRRVLRGVPRNTTLHLEIGTPRDPGRRPGCSRCGGPPRSGE